MRNFARSNLKDVLKEVFYNPGIMRHVIGDRLSMAAATVSKYVDILITRGVIAEEPNTRGRNVKLTVNPAWHTTLGVDIGGALVRIGRLAAGGEFSMISEFPTPDNAELLGRIIRKHQTKVDAVGIAVTAVVVPAESRIFIFPNKRSWDGVDFTPFGITSLTLMTSGNAAANYEKKFGALRAFRNCMHINFGYGIQSGLFVNDDLVQGAGHAAGEFGHVFSTAEAGKCTCGNTGCLENVATVPMVEDALRKRLTSGELRGTLARLCGNDPAKMSLALIRDACIGRDPQAVAAMKAVADAVGSALSGIVNVLNPEGISLGGRLFAVFPELVDEVRAAVRLRALEANSRNLAVVVAASPLQGACAGAALLPMERFLDEYGDSL